ncbi:Nucleolar protein 4 [Halotydeus destructor]|nr:Nucleolar protein 4 [Halotydeus destructor]
MPAASAKVHLQNRPQAKSTSDLMFDAYQAWAMKTYGDSAKTKTVTTKKYNRIVKILKGEESSNVENSKFRFWVKAKGFRIDSLLDTDQDEEDSGDGDQVLYVACSKAGTPSTKNSSKGSTDSSMDAIVYKRVAVVENFYDIIYNVHVEMDGRSGKHAGQKRTYRAVAEMYAFLPREAVTRFLMSCADCQKRMHLQGICQVDGVESPEAEGTDETCEQFALDMSKADTLRGAKLSLYDDSIETVIMHEADSRTSNGLNGCNSTHNVRGVKRKVHGDATNGLRPEKVLAAIGDKHNLVQRSKRSKAMAAEEALDDMAAYEHDDEEEEEEDDDEEKVLSVDVQSAKDEDEDEEDDEDISMRGDCNTGSHDPERLKAFNMFVRLFVDENLDRMVPISRQPKEKIQAIIDSCLRQFPEFGERARKRIRTYLKSCRRTRRTKAQLASPGSADQDGSHASASATTPTSAPASTASYHMSSALAEQILATACDNEYQNAKRMRLGLAPVAVNVTLESDHSGPSQRGNQCPEPQPQPPAATLATFSTGPSSGAAVQLLKATNGTQSSSSSLLAALCQQQRSKSQGDSAPAATNGSPNGRSSSSNGQDSSGGSGSIMAGFDGLQRIEQSSKQRTTGNGSINGLYQSVAAARQNGSMTSSSSLALSASNCTSASNLNSPPRYSLNPGEMAAVKQLISGYRESAAFLLRSADELENLLIQQS